MVREAYEETWIIVKENNLEKIWIMNFHFSEKPEYNNQCYVFLIHKYNWNIVETREIEPHWFDLENIPYETMWQADKTWLKQYLQDWKYFEATYYYDKDNWDVSRIENWLH